MNPPEKLSSTMEDYLETIHALKEKQGFTRVGAIAERLEVKSSSVNSAIKVLSDKGLVIHKKYGYVDLTDEGVTLAKEVQSKHDLLFRFLTEFLMLERSLAEKEACCIEHAISKQTFKRLTQFFVFLEEEYKGDDPGFIKKFEAFINKIKAK